MPSMEYLKADEAVRRARERLPIGTLQEIENLAVDIMGEITAEVLAAREAQLKADAEALEAEDLRRRLEEHTTHPTAWEHLVRDDG